MNPSKDYGQIMQLSEEEVRTEHPPTLKRRKTRLFLVYGCLLVLAFAWLIGLPATMWHSLHLSQLERHFSRLNHPKGSILFHRISRVGTGPDGTLCSYTLTEYRSLPTGFTLKQLQNHYTRQFEPLRQGKPEQDILVNVQSNSSVRPLQNNLTVQLTPSSHESSPPQLFVIEYQELITDWDNAGFDCWI